MAVWSGLGVNYKGAQANWDADIAYFKAIGIQSVRPHMPNISMPWSAGSVTPGSYAFWRYCAQYFHTAGFWVTWGPSTNVTLTSSNWTDYHDAVVAEATYLQAQGIVIDEFAIGNELENRTDVTISDAQLHTNLRQLAADVKAVYSGTVTYAVGDGDGDVNYADWVSTGIGALNTISIHPYGVINTFNNTVQFVHANAIITQFSNAFGTSAYISEFNIDSNMTRLMNLPPSIAVAAMNTMFTTIKNSGFTKAQIYSWVGYLNGDNQFAQLYTSGAMNPQWFSLFTSQPTFYTPRGACPSRTTVSRSSAIINRAAVPNRYLVR